MVLDDSLVLFIYTERRVATAIGPDYKKEYYSLYIEETMYNQLGYKHNHAKFMKNLCDEMGVEHINYSLPASEGSCVLYRKFRGFDRIYWDLDYPSIPEYVNENYPEINLKERYEKWDGITYYLILVEFHKKDNTLVRGCGYTVTKPHLYMTNLGEKFIKTGNLKGEFRISLSEFEAFKKSWQGVKRQTLLEEHMTYFFIEQNFREKNNVWQYADKLIKQAEQGLYKDYARSTYIRPVYKWTTEELVLKIVKRLYKNYTVIYQHKPFFLISPFGGQMSYDIYIQNLNVAIEYQGEQHFHPVEFFGGEGSFEKQKIRDKAKYELSKKHGIKLVYINFNENITSSLVREKIEK